MKRVLSLDMFFCFTSNFGFFLFGRLVLTAEFIVELAIPKVITQSLKWKPLGSGHVSKVNNDRCTMPVK